MQFYSKIFGTFGSQVRVGNGVRIPVYGIGPISLFVVLKDGSIKKVMLKIIYMFLA
jgi:hypothetical protein